MSVSVNTDLCTVLLLLPLLGPGEAVVIQHLASNHPVTLGVGRILGRAWGGEGSEGAKGAGRILGRAWGGEGSEGVKGRRGGIGDQNLP